jgi:hypothetical protein
VETHTKTIPAGSLVTNTTTGKNKRTKIAWSLKKLLDLIGNTPW